MRDQALWSAAKVRALAEADLAGVTGARVIVRQARAEYLVLVEIASGIPSTPTLSVEKLQKTNDLEPLQISAEQLRIWQERNRSQATEAEMEAATRLVPEEACGLCDGARFIRDPEFRPGTKAQVPMHGHRTIDALTGALPCPECNVKSSFEALLARSNVPTSLHGLTFDTAEPRPGKVEAIAELREWSKNPRQSLCLHGLFGVGKTHLSVAAVIACCQAGLRAEFWPLQSLLREMQLRFGAAADSAQAFEESVTRVPVLVLDDVGAEQRSQSGWSTEVFERMLDARLSTGLPTLITTNLTPAALSQHVDARAASRLKLFRFVEIGGTDMRAEIGRKMAEVV